MVGATRLARAPKPEGVIIHEVTATARIRWTETGYEFTTRTGKDEMVAAAARQPAGTLLLRSDRLSPAELADEVLAAAGTGASPGTITLERTFGCRMEGLS